MTDDEGVAVSGEEVKGSIEQALVREQLLDSSALYAK